MNILEDIIGTAKQSIGERLSSPLISSFAISWVLWNWKFLVIMFSTASVTQTFQMVEQHSFSGSKDVLLNGFFLPLISSLIYVFAYPYPAKFIYGYTLKRQREIDQLKQKINDETPLTIEDSQKLRAEYVEYEKKNYEQISKLNEEIARLNSILDKTNKVEMANSKSSRDIRKNSLATYDVTKSQLALLKLLADSKLPAKEERLISNSDASRVQAEYDLGELLRIKLIDKSFDFQGEAMIDFTHDGRGVLLEKINNEKNG